jgi:hypothetical protein
MGCIHLCFLLVLFVVSVNSISINKADVHPPPGVPNLNITGFSWAENLFFDGQGNLFVSDLNTGILWKVFYNDTSSTYEKAPFSQFDKVAGLTLVKTDHDVTIFAATTLNSNATLVALNPNATTGTPVIVAELANMGNGLSVWAPHGEATFFVALSYDYIANQSVG